MDSQRLPSFFLMKRTGAPPRDLLGQMKLFLVFSSRKFLCVASLGGNKEWTGLWKGLVPSSRLIFKSYGLWGAKMFAFSPENTLQNSRYSLGMVSGKVSVSATIADLALRFSLPICMSGLYWCVPGEITNVAFSGFLCSLVMVQALTQWMSTPVVVVGIGFGVTSLWKVIFISVQSMIGLWQVSQSYPSTTEYSSSNLVI